MLVIGTLFAIYYSMSKIRVRARTELELMERRTWSGKLTRPSRYSDTFIRDYRIGLDLWLIGKGKVRQLVLFNERG